MSLYIYSEPDITKLLSDSSPFTITFDGRIGGSQDKLIYIRNNNSARYYTDITLNIIDNTGYNIVDGSREGFMWKLMEKDIAPTNKEWSLVSPGNTLSLSSDLGNSTLADTITFLPVWVRVVVPRGQKVQAITDVILRISATEIVI